MKFTRFIVYLWLRSHEIVRTSTNFINFVKVIFWTQNVLILTFLLLLTCNKSIFHQVLSNLTNFYHHHFIPSFILLSTFTTFHQFLPASTTTSYHFLCYFYQLFPPSTNFYYFSSIFTNFNYLSPTFVTFHLFLPTFILLLLTFYHILPTFTIFHQLLPTFYQYSPTLPTFHQFLYY